MDENTINNFWMEGDSLAPPCQTDADVIDVILRFAVLSQDSFVFDLGCGDGRICIEASLRYGCRSCGVEIEEKLTYLFRRRIDELKLHDLVTAVHGDLLDLDLSEATVIILYLLPDAIKILEPKLAAAIRSGKKLICNTWGPKSLIPTKKVVCGQLNNIEILLYG